MTHLDEELPDNVLRKGLAQLFALLDVCAKISVRSVLHNDAKPVAIEESFVVADLHTTRQRLYSR